MLEPRVTALIIARDEANELPGCIESLRWVDEIVVVVDTASADSTEEIARKSADRVVARKFDNFAAQRNAGLELATGDWVLAIDADERSTPEFEAEVAERLRTCDGVSAYRVPIRSIVFGRVFRGSGTQLDRPIRLFRRADGRWAGEVHEFVEVSGRVQKLRSPLLHRTHETLHEFLAKLNHYTDLEAAALFAGGGRPHWHDFSIRPFWCFVKLWLLRGGYRDGAEGMLFCAMSGVSVLARAWKLRELMRGATRGHNAAIVSRPTSRGIWLAPSRGAT